MNLVWKDPKRSAESRRPRTNESEHVDPNNKESRTKEGGERHFRFVKGRRRIKRKLQPPGAGKDHSTVNDVGNFSSPNSGFFVLNANANSSTLNAASAFGDSSPSESSNAERINHESEAGKCGLLLSSSIRIV